MKKIAYVRATNIFDDSRATKELLTLTSAGYHVTVFGWGRNEQAASLCERVFKNAEGKMDFHFFPKPLAAGIGIKNIDKLIAWFRWVYSSLKKNGEFDAVHACNLDAGLGAYRYCKKYNIPLIYDIYDYYIDSHAIPPLLANTVEKMEINIINHAKVTIICTAERKEQIAKATPQKVIVLHNSPDVEKIEVPNCRYDYAYCGSLGHKRLLSEMFGEYKNNSDLTFAVAGYGDYTETVSRLSEEFENFSFSGTIPYDQVLQTESEARILSAIYQPTIRNHRLCAPNKFYEALALAKPLIVCRGTGIDRIVEQNNIGMVIDYNAEEFYSALRTLLADPDKCREMGERARKIYEKEYRWPIMADRLLQTYQQLFRL